MVHALDGKAVAAAVQVAVAAFLHAVALEERPEFPGIRRRGSAADSAEAQLFGRISRRAERGLQTQQLPLENFIVMTASGASSSKEPAARAGQGDAVIEIAVVIQQIQVRESRFPRRSGRISRPSSTSNRDFPLR